MRIRIRILTAKLLVLPLFALALLSHHMYSEDSLADLGLETGGFLLLLVAAMGRVWASAYISGRKSATLVTDGPYSIVRNPLYFFSFVGFLGAGLAFESVALAAAFGLLFFLTHWPTILREENRLYQLFGEQFTHYRQSVPRFLPNPWKLSNPSSVDLAPQLFTRAIMESSLVLSVFLLAHVVEWAHLHAGAPVYFTLP